jgi:hypothetical protein
MFVLRCRAAASASGRRFYLRHSVRYLGWFALPATSPHYSQISRIVAPSSEIEASQRSEWE